MALTVGELNGIISIDDRQVDPALRRAENALRQSGQRMGDDADRAGQQAGQQLGDGIVRGADGQLRDLRGNVVTAVRSAGNAATPAARRAGEDAGDALGDGLADGAGDGADAAVGEVTSNLDKLKTVGAGIAATAGAAIGAALVGAISDYMEQGQIVGRLAASLGQTPAEAQRYGKLAGKLYADAITEDFQSAADTIGAVMGSGLIPADATNKQIESISTKVADLANTFDQDLPAVTNAATQLIRTGLAKNADEAFDLIAKGFTTSANKADDFLDTINEYSVQFKRVGLDGKTSIGLINQAISKGARDSDQVADAIGQFGELALAGGKGVETAFKSIGLNADTIRKKLQKGGKSGQEALQLTTDALRDQTDKQTRLNAATALFGDPGTVMGDALFALDPAGAAAQAGMDKASGAAGRMGDALRDNAGTKVEQFKRGLQQGLVNFLGYTVLPKLTEVKVAAGHLWDDAGKGGKEGADRVISFFGIVGQRLVTKARELAPKFIAGLQQAGQDAANYILANPESALKIGLIAAAIAGAILLIPVLIAGALASSATLIMVGFTRKMISALNENLPKWLAAFGNWLNAQTAKIPGMFNGLGVAIGGWFAGLWSRYIAGPVSRQWNLFLGTVRALPGKAVGALAALAPSLTGVSNRAWQQFASAAASKATSFIGWVRGLPGRISSGVGSLGSLLYGKGQNVVQGLWNGISSMSGWIRGQLMSWARSAIPGPIAKALGIASPSKVTKAQGRWIARGLVAGLTGNTKQVKSAATKLADIVRDSLSPGKRRSKALKLISTQSGALAKLATREAALATRMKAAQKKVSDLVKARDKLAADVKAGVLSGADITKQETGGWPQTAESILAGLKADTQAAQVFAKNLALLRKKGVRSDLIAQIAQAGVDQGSSAAAALATANSGQIKQINAQQKALVTAAGQAGTTAGNAMYGAGIQAAQGIVKGLQSQQKAIDKAMLRIAKGMSKAIRAALGIKSPSRVMALVGQYTAQGLIKGVEGQRSAVNKSMASLVETPAAGSWDMASSRARAAAAQRVVVEFRSPARGEDAYLMGRMRRGVQRVSGGNVEFALSGRRNN